MVQAMVSEGTASQQASAAQHLERRDEWRYYWVDGVRYVRMVSARSGRIYRLRADGDGCECAAYLIHGYAVCAHMLALRMARAADATPEPIRTLRPRYADLFPSCAGGCGDLVERDGERCYVCGSDREYQQRMESKRAAGSR